MTEVVKSTVAKRKIGRPRTPEKTHYDRSGFTASQRKLLRLEAKKRGIPMAMVVREMADYYFTALDRSRNQSAIPASEEIPTDKQ